MNKNLLKETFERIETYINEVETSDNYWNENNLPSDLLKKNRYFNY